MLPIVPIIKAHCMGLYTEGLIFEGGLYSDINDMVGLYTGGGIISGGLQFHIGMEKHTRRSPNKGPNLFHGFLC